MGHDGALDQAIRGVNLGGWLVLERWMTPSLFAGSDAPDEYSLCQQATTARLGRLRQHRQTFVTKKDFQWLRARGINAVRIPVGYWLRGTAPPYQATLPYLDDAFGWAEATGLRVLLSIHGAPGSQNGRDHSGRQGPVAWHSDRRNIDETLELVRFLAGRYRSPRLLGIGLLNEPAASIPRATLEAYYRAAYHVIRQVGGPDPWVVFSDRFQANRWNGVLPWPSYRRTAIDSHQYQLYSQADKSMPADDHLRRTITGIPLQLERTRRWHGLVVGEWSAALDERSLAGLDPDGARQACRAYVQAQLYAYGRADAWFYWNYKVEGGGAWSFYDCWQKGWFR